MPPRRSTADSGETRGMAVKVAESVAHLDLKPEDGAVSDLAMKYAETIDRAAAIAARAARIPYDEDTAEEVKRLAARVAAHTTMADLGPKLLAALEALGATPKARAAAGKTTPPRGPSKLDRLRDGTA